MPDFGIFRGFNDKLFGNKLYAGQLPTQLGIIGSIDFGYDIDALAFFDRVTAAGGTLSATEQLAINQLVLDLKNYSIWSKMKAIYPMVGASAAACAQNLKSSSFTGTFNGGVTIDSSGILGNGTNGYLNLNIKANDLDQNSASYGVVSSINISENKISFGADEFYAAFFYGSASYFYSINTTLTSVSDANSLGFYMVSRTANNLTTAYKNGTQVGTISTLSNTPKNLNLFALAYNSGGSPASFSVKKYNFIFVGDSINSTDANNLNDIVTTFNNSLSR